MTRNKLFFNKTNSGFSLIETIISMSILLIVLSSVIFTVMQMLNADKRSMKIDASNQLIRDLLEKYSSKQEDIPIVSLPINSLYKPENIDSKYKDSSKAVINDSIRIAVFPSSIPAPSFDGVNVALLPDSLNKLVWIKIAAYEKNKPDANISSYNDLKLLSQVTTVIDVK